MAALLLQQAYRLLSQQRHIYGADPEQLTAGLTKGGLKPAHRASIRQLVIDGLGALRQLSGISGRADAGDCDGQAGAHGQIVIVRRNNGVVKLVGGFGSRYHHQRGTDRAGVAVRGSVHHRQLVLSFLLGNKGGRSAAIQIYCHHASGIQHNLRNLDCTATGGNRFLPTVHNHQHHAIVSRDTHAGTRSPAVIVVAATADNNLTVAYQHDAATHGFGDIVFILCIIRRHANDRCAILEDSKEVSTASAVILHTLHNQCAGGCTVGHVVEVGIHADHRGVVGNVQIRL